MCVLASKYLLHSRPVASQTPPNFIHFILKDDGDLKSHPTKAKHTHTDPHTHINIHSEIEMHTHKHTYGNHVGQTVSDITTTSHSLSDPCLPH